jgi:predicted nucleic acid-binding protein
LRVVIDANLLVALALNDPRAPAVDRHVREWASAGETLHAPALLRYEAANALTRAVAAGHLARDRVVTAWERITRVDMQLNTLADGVAAVETALRLERSNAYDAAYVVLAQTLDADLWTLDGPLARNARGLGLSVRLVPVDPHSTDCLAAATVFETGALPAVRPVFLGD